MTESRVVREDGVDAEREAEGERGAPVVVPWERLSPEALRGVIEELVSREGTEYGLSEVALETKVASVRRQLERGTVVMLFDTGTSSVNLATKEELRRLGLDDG